MPINREAIEAGFEFERDFARSTGATLQPASGNKWYARLDNKHADLIWSLKSAPTARSFRVTAEMIQEMLEAAAGPGGTGRMGLMAIRFQGIPEDLTLGLTSDFFRILRGEVQLPPATSKGETNRAIADTPFLMR